MTSRETQDAAANQDGNIQVVMIGLGHEKFALDAGLVREIIDPVPVTKVAGTKSFVPSVINVRGNVIPLADLRIRFGMPVTEDSAETRIVVIELEIDNEPVLVGVTAVAQNPNAAKLYVNWVLSKRGGAAITRLFVDWATHPDVPPPSLEKYGLKLPPASTLWTGDRKEWAELQSQWLKEWEKVFESN